GEYEREFVIGREHGGEGFEVSTQTSGVARIPGPCSTRKLGQQNRTGVCDRFVVSTLALLRLRAVVGAGQERDAVVTELEQVVHDHSSCGVGVRAHATGLGERSTGDHDYGNFVADSLLEDGLEPINTSGNDDTIATHGKNPLQRAPLFGQVRVPIREMRGEAGAREGLCGTVIERGGRQYPDCVRPAILEASGQAVRAIAERVDCLLDARACVYANERGAGQEARHRLGGHAREAPDIVESGAPRWGGVRWCASWHVLLRSGLSSSLWYQVVTMLAIASLVHRPC